MRLLKARFNSSSSIGKGSNSDAGGPSWSTGRLLLGIALWNTGLDVGLSFTLSGDSLLLFLVDAFP